MIDEIDRDGTQRISFDDFLHLMTLKMAEKDTKEEILKAFRLFDDDGSGKITFKNLKRVARQLDEKLTDEELREMIDQTDLNNDGEVDQDEFLHCSKLVGGGHFVGTITVNVRCVRDPEIYYDVKRAMHRSVHIK
uniref:EF-hand domain-containing protein n=1 Tax=Glossina austeni TaxID=7395 RepID=A0A1A9VG47_GLOAU